jgi:hypothetical protein
VIRRAVGGAPAIGFIPFTSKSLRGGISGRKNCQSGGHVIVS